MKIRLVVSGLVLAALGLPGCSAGTTQSTPALAAAHATPVGVSAETGAKLIVTGVKRDAGCPSEDYGCVTVSAQNPASIFVCFWIPSTNRCNQPPPVTWSSRITTRRSVFTNKFSASFNPNPGSQTTDTISEIKPVKPSGGKYKWFQTITYCDSTSKCYTYGWVGIATQ